jgi:hypothetical protein
MNPAMTHKLSANTWSWTPSLGGDSRAPASRDAGESRVDRAGGDPRAATPFITGFFIVSSVFVTGDNASGVILAGT